MASRNAEESQRRSPHFATTRWSLVAAAAETAAPKHREALADLCELYWYPVYAFLRRRGADPDTALDEVQGFFSQMLEKNYLKAAKQERGRFRSFLITALKFHLSDTAKHDRAKKRGGGTPRISLDGVSAEQRYRVEPVEDHTPETLFERRCALALLDRAMARLHEQVANSPRLLRLSQYLTGEPAEGGYREAASELEMSEGAVKVAVHRLRQRYGRFLREEVAHTVDDPGKVDEEVRHVFEVLQRRPGGH